MTEEVNYRFTTPLRVRWAEVDMQKIVFNGHYLMYADTAVSEYWRALGLPYESAMALLGGDLYVKKATVEYHASAHYDELLSLGVRCAGVGNSSILLQCAIGLGQAGEAGRLVDVELVYVFADPATQKSKPVPQALKQLLAAFEAGQPMLHLEGGQVRNRLGQTVGSAAPGSVIRLTDVLQGAGHEARLLSEG